VSTQSSGQQSLLSLRTAVILLIGVQAAVVAGILTYLAGNPPATAALAGVTAFGGAVAFAHSAIG